MEILRPTRIRFLPSNRVVIEEKKVVMVNSELRIVIGGGQK